MSKLGNTLIKSLADVGSDPTKLINTEKIYDPFLDKQLSEAILDGSIGGDGINHLVNGKADDGLTSWNTFFDAAGTIPVDGTGGSPTNTLSVDATSKLRGVNSFKYSKLSGNKQGEGFSQDYLSEAADSTLLQKVSFNLTVTSGYIDNEASVYCYNKTDSSLIFLTNSKIKSSTNSQEFVGYFYNPSGITDLRFIVHIGGTDTTAWDMFFDNVSISPANEVKDTINREVVFRGEGNAGQSLTANVTDIPFISVEDDLNSWDGDSYTVKQDGMYLIDGSCRFNTSEVAEYKIYKNGVFLKTTGSFALSETIAPFQHLDRFEKDDVITIRSNTTAVLINVPTQHYIAIVKVGGPANISDTTGRQVGIVGTGAPSATITAAVTNVPFLVQDDVFGLWDGSVFTANESGVYMVSGMTDLTSGAVRQTYAYIDTGSGFAINENLGTQMTINVNVHPFCGQVKLNKGDKFALRLTVNGGSLDSGASTNQHILITKIADLPGAVLPNFTKESTVILATDKTLTNSDTAGLTRNDLTIGKKYRISGQMRFTRTSSGLDNFSVFLRSAANGGGDVYGVVEDHISTSGGACMKNPNIVFTAVSTDLYFYTSSFSSGTGLRGNGTTGETFITIEELPNHTSVDTL